VKISALTLSPDQIRAATERKVRPYLGRADWPWLLVAMNLPGRALAVGLAAWHLRNLTRSTAVALNLSRMPFDRWAAARGLRALEGAGLVAVDRHRGRKPLVTILSASGPTS
jgi:hypothetical protein